MASGARRASAPEPKTHRRVSNAVEVEKATISEKDLKHIFESFDYDKSGSIDERELHQAIKMLGVTCSLNTAKKILSQIDSNSNGLVEWDEFQAFFARVGDPEDIKEMLSMQSQRFFEYKQAVTSDSNFAKLFRIPPSKSATCRLDRHNEAVESVRWVDDSTAISASIDGDVCVWDMGRLDEKKKPELKSKFNVASGGDALAVYSMTLSRDGRSLAVGLDFKDAPNVKTFDIDSGSVRSEHSGHTSAVYGCTYSADGTLIASGGKNGMLCLHDPNSAESLQKVQGHMSVVHSVEFQKAGGCVLCSASKDGTVKIFDVRSTSFENSKPEFIIEDAAASGTVTQALWRDEVQLLSCGDDFCIKRWDLRNLVDGPVSSYFGHTDVIRAITISDDGNYLASGTHSGSVRIWNVDELGVLQSACAEYEEELPAMEARAEEITDRFKEGMADIEELRDAQGALESYKATAEKTMSRYNKMKLKGYSEGVLSCDGFRLPVSSMAWRGGSPGRLVVGCQDQSVRLFDLSIAPIL